MGLSAVATNSCIVAATAEHPYAASLDARLPSSAEARWPSARSTARSPPRGCGTNRWPGQEAKRSYRQPDMSSSNALYMSGSVPGVIAQVPSRPAGSTRWSWDQEPHFRFPRWRRRRRSRKCDKLPPATTSPSSATRRAPISLTSDGQSCGFGRPAVPDELSFHADRQSQQPQWRGCHQVPGDLPFQAWATATGATPHNSKIRPRSTPRIRRRRRLSAVPAQLCVDLTIKPAPHMRTSNHYPHRRTN